MDGFPASYRIFHDDCLAIDQREPSYLFDLIYMEPPLDGLAPDLLIPRLERLFSRLHESGFLLIHTSRYQSYSVKSVIDQIGLPFKGDIVWSYRQRSVKTQALQNQHDSLLVYSCSRSYQSKRILMAHSVVGPSSAERTGFSGQKPVGLFKRIIRRLDAYHRIEYVLDPYMGSGSALVAALEMGRFAVGFDTSSQACMTAEKRLLQSVPESRQMQMEIE